MRFSLILPLFISCSVALPEVDLSYENQLIQPEGFTYGWETLFGDEKTYLKLEMINCQHISNGTIKPKDAMRSSAINQYTLGALDDEEISTLHKEVSLIIRNELEINFEKGCFNKFLGEELKSINSLDSLKEQFSTYKDGSLKGFFETSFQGSKATCFFYSMHLKNGGEQDLSILIANKAKEVKRLIINPTIKSFKEGAIQLINSCNE